MARISMWVHVVIAGSVGLLGASAEPAPVAVPASAGKFFSGQILLGAHRGGKDLWPEDTAFAYTQAVSKFRDILLECDARFTSDGAVVILHDPTVDRTTNGAGKVADLTLAQVKALDAGYKFTIDGVTFPYRGKGVTIPMLAEALKAAPNSRFVVEFKGDAKLADAGVKILRDSKAVDRVIIASFVPETMARVRQIAPELPTCYDFTTGVAMLGALRGANWASYKPTSDMLSVDEGMLPQYHIQPADIKAIQAKGIRFQIHTINSPEGMKKYLDMGVDSILTDNPDLLAKAIGERK